MQINPLMSGAYATIKTGMLKFGQILFFCVGKFLRILQNFRYFFGSDKYPAIILGLITHLNPLNEEFTVLKTIKS